VFLGREEYEIKFKEQIITEIIQIINEDLIRDLKYYLKNNTNLDSIYQGINKYEENFNY
jgi:uncharacterized protein YfkK (UPF0435 family)